MKMATHRVLLYETLVTGKDISPALKFLALKRGIKSLLDRGKVVIGARYRETMNPVSGFCVGSYAFETVYVGRKAIWKNAIRHQLRREHEKFLSEPIVVPYLPPNFIHKLKP